MARVAINGLGRIGRATLKIVMETPGLDLVAVNDLAPPASVVYLLKYDSVYGRHDKPIAASDDTLVVGRHRLTLLNEKDPALLPWRKLDVDIVFECTGAFRQRDMLVKHVEAGATYVIVSAPTSGDEVETIVHGVNRPQGGTSIISCASCTTNCITPVLEILGRRIGVHKAIMTTLHAYTASQHIVDGPDKDARRGRAGAANFVPTSTGAVTSATKALPQYRGRFDGVAIRGPVAVGSLANIIVLTARPTSIAEVNKVFVDEATTERYRGIVGVSSDPLVSSDIIKDPRASVIDLGMTQVVDGDLVRVMSWYDNEWGYSSQMVREASRIAQVIDDSATARASNHG